MISKPPREVWVRVAGLPVKLDNLFELCHGLIELSPPMVDQRDVVAGHRFPGPVPDLPPDRQRLPVVLQRPPRLASTLTRPYDGDHGTT